MKAIKIPFSFEGGGVAATTNRNVIEEQKIINVLVTSNFERVFNPTYGAGALNLVYELNDPLVFFDFKTEAMFELKDNISSCEVLNMIARNEGFLENEENVMMIDVTYQLPPGVVEVTSVRLAVPGQITEDTPF